MAAFIDVQAADMTAGEAVDKRQEMDQFLASVESKAFRLAMAQLRDRDAALDAVQDAMIRLVQKYAHKPKDQWSPLFFRILMNRIRDDQRAAKRFVDDADYALQQTAADNPEQQLQQQQAIGALEQAVEALPQRQREAVMLRVWQGFNVAQTAGIMGCGEGSVKTHLSRAMAVLRSRVEEFCS
ncbi:MAG: sigma-70 family RNA polymerase sigma factor [Oceanococcus sp.]